MPERELAESTKRKNIIDMALTFTAMMRVFSEGSKARIASKFEELCSELERIDSREKYLALHRSFCQWFVRDVTTAQKKLKNGKVKPSQSVSFGHAAKVLDIAIKVYVHYCCQPSPDIAEKLLPLLNGAVDNPIMKHLKATYPEASVTVSTIQEVDEKTYATLQQLVVRDISANFHDKVLPVQYDDIMWYLLNRGPNLALHGKGLEGFEI